MPATRRPSASPKPTASSGQGHEESEGRQDPFTAETGRQAVEKTKHRKRASNTPSYVCASAVNGFPRIESAFLPSQNLFHHIPSHVRQPELPPLKLARQAQMIDPQTAQVGARQIGHVLPAPIMLW